MQKFADHFTLFFSNNECPCMENVEERLFEEVKELTKYPALVTFSTVSEIILMLGAFAKLI